MHTMTVISLKRARAAGCGPVIFLDGYYRMKGPGLPYSSEKAAFAALDFVIVFKVKKQ